MKYNCIFWDFNGTVIDDVKAGIDSVNPLLEARGLEKVSSIDEYKALFDFPVKDYYKKLGFDFNKEPYEIPAHQWFDNYNAKIPEMQTVSGVKELIEFFKTCGAKQYILSASEGDILKRQLKYTGLDGKFEKILSLDNIYADSKLKIALDFFKSSGLDKSKCLMIGDTTHDAEVAKGVGIDACIVACGHMSYDRLTKTGFPVYHDMDELLNTFKNAPIAVIDSGVGGISVLKELVSIMPNENYIYFADSKNAPYGTKSRDTVRDITLENTEKLLSMGAKAIVVACNTATSAAVRLMREKYPALPIVGIEPAIKPAASVCEHPTVAVMATPLTLAQEKFRLLTERFAQSEDIIPLPCPGLMEIIESGHTDGEIVDNYISKLFEPLAGKEIHAVVLGCTHYPFIKKSVEKYFGGKVKVFDGGHGTAKEAQRRIEAVGLENTGTKQGKVEFISTNGDKGVCTLSKKLLEEC